MRLRRRFSPAPEAWWMAEDGVAYQELCPRWR
jgi:hypothetical protein